ncbi:Predicted membrane protein [Priestia filamentosa]|nr:Predicted membrane protein [Priestia filamentosa]
MVGILFEDLSGLYLACYATGGLIAKLGFGFLSLLWLQSAYKALRMIRQRNISAHYHWMIRNYSLTFAAITLRLWLPLFMMLFGLVNFEVSYAIIAWLAWVPNLIVGELYYKIHK